MFCMFSYFREVAHSVNKYALKEYPFGCGYPTRNCGNAAISLAQSANFTVATGNNITHALRAYHRNRVAIHRALYTLSPLLSIATTHGKSSTSNSCIDSVPRSQ